MRIAIAARVRYSSSTSIPYLASAAAHDWATSACVVRKLVEGFGGGIGEWGGFGVVDGEDFAPVEPLDRNRAGG